MLVAPTVLSTSASARSFLAAAAAPTAVCTSFLGYVDRVVGRGKVPAESGSDAGISTEESPLALVHDDGDLPFELPVPPP